MNLHPDNRAVRALNLIGGLAVLPLAVLLFLTVLFSFNRSSESANATAHVHSCEDIGPISWRGFGHNWKCTATIQEDDTGESWTATRAFNFFTPDEIGTPQRISVGHSLTSDKVFYSQTEGWSSAAVGIIDTIAAIFIFIPALWLFSRLIVRSFKQEEQRKFWEKIHGTPEERAAKKQKDKEFWEEMRRNRAQRKETRRRAKEARKR